jgi:hypothetical protein
MGEEAYISGREGVSGTDYIQLAQGGVSVGIRGPGLRVGIVGMDLALAVVRDAGCWDDG